MGMVAGGVVCLGCVEGHAALGLCCLQLSHMPHAVAVNRLLKGTGPYSAELGARAGFGWPDGWS